MYSLPQYQKNPNRDRTDSPNWRDKGGTLRDFNFLLQNITKKIYKNYAKKGTTIIVQFLGPNGRTWTILVSSCGMKKIRITVEFHMIERRL